MKKNKCPLKSAMISGNVNIVKYIIDYAYKHKCNLEWDEEMVCTLMEEKNLSQKDLMEILKLVIDYYDKRNIILDFNKSDDILLMAANLKNTEVIKLLMDYYDRHDRVLELYHDPLSVKINIILFYTMTKNKCESSVETAETVKLFMDYATKHNIVLDLNKISKIFKVNIFSYSFFF